MALGFTYGHARQSCFAPELVADSGLRALAGRVRVEVDPDLDRAYPERRATGLVVTTIDGRTLRADVPFARGEPELPLTDDDLVAKFLDNARPALSDARATAIVELVRSLDRHSTCADLFEILSGRPVPVPVR